MNADGSRSFLVSALLLLTLAVAAMLGWQGWREARSRADLTTQVLGDYAGTASWEFARRGERALLIGLNEALLAVQPPPGPEPPPSPYAPFAVRPVLGSFRLDLETGRVIASEIDLPDAVRAPVWDAARNRMQDGRRADGLPCLAFTGEPADPRVFGYLVTPGRNPEVVGIETTTAALLPVLARVYERDPLLPPSLMRSAGNRDLVSIVVQTASGRVLYRSPGEPVVNGRTQALDARFGGLRASAMVRPAAVERLIPTSVSAFNWWTIGGLLALEALLVAATLLQFRRQRELARLRTEFVSAASHELRTPLAQIRLFAETLRLRRVRSGNEERRAIEILDQESRRLSNLVENVLLFSRGEKGMNRVAPEPIELAPLATAVVETFAPLARARSVDVVLRAPDPAVVAVADRAALQQVLLNLLDNAVKYGPDDQTVIVSIRTSGDTVQVLVEDQGPGIPDGDRERIFRPFYRSSGARTSAVAGTGIGLAVVRELMTLQGGKAWCEPRAEGGSRFVVELRHP